MKISYSQLQKYQICPKSYEFYYAKKIRPETKTASLVFGASLDEALNSLLLERDLDKAKRIFEEKFKTTEVNGQVVDLFNTDKIVYSVNDFDEDLLFDEDLKLLQNLTPYPTLDDIRRNLGFDNMSTNHKIEYNKYNYLSLRNKGFLMLEAYYEDILPKIKRVVEVQKKIELENSHKTDSIIGYVDLIAEVEGYGLTIIDNKTSSIPYESESVFTSQQLSLYAFMSNLPIEYGAYAVLLKPIKKDVYKRCSKCDYDGSGSRHKTCNNEINNKRCNGEWLIEKKLSVRTQFIIDRINKDFQNVVVDNLDIIVNNIKNGIFPYNFQSCLNYWGGKCDYFDICYKNKSVDSNKK